jgi:hypothetical protein
MATIEKKRNPVIGETCPLKITCTRSDKTRVDLTGATMWLTLKTAPDTQADAAAALQLDSLHEYTQFSIVAPPTRGVFTVTMSATNTAALTAGTIYYIDVKVRDSLGNMYFPVPNQPLQFTQWVSRATSES